MALVVEVWLSFAAGRAVMDAHALLLGPYPKST